MQAALGGHGPRTLHVAWAQMSSMAPFNLSLPQAAVLPACVPPLRRNLDALCKARAYTSTPVSHPCLRLKLSPLLSHILTLISATIVGFLCHVG